MKKEKLSREECKMMQVQILDEISEICHANGIHYSLAYGTLLGAVRHQGFIPWDDDIDIYLSREEYEKLLAVLKAPESNKPDWLELIDGDKEGYFYPFAKAVNNTTTAKMEDNITKHGIWIDIFPEDRVPESRFHQMLYVKFGKFLRDVIIAMTTDFTSQKKDSKKAVKKLISLFAGMIGKKNIYRLTDKYYQKYRNSNSKVFACMSTCYGTKEIMSEEILFSQGEIEFESKKYQSTKYWDAYLKKLYGDYMKLPPEQDRRVHSITAWRNN